MNVRYGRSDHPEAGEALALYIVPDKGTGDVTQRVRHSLPAHWTVESIRIVAEIPKTARGKISRTFVSADGNGTIG